MNMQPDWISAFTTALLQFVQIFFNFFLDFFRQGLAAFLI